MKNKALKIKRITAIVLAAASLAAAMALLSGCGKQRTCDWCGKTWRGDAYYADSLNDTLCDECAQGYWDPLPYRNYKK